MDAAAVEQRVIAIVRRMVPGARNADSTSALVLLGEEGIFDSVTALELIVALEQEFSIVIRDEDVRPENLGNVGSIVAFVIHELSRSSEQAQGG